MSHLCHTCLSDCNLLSNRRLTRSCPGAPFGARLMRRPGPGAVGIRVWPSHRLFRLIVQKLYPGSLVCFYATRGILSPWKENSRQCPKIRDILDLSRNHFDRVGHFAQGFTPALLIREVLIRSCKMKRGWMLGFLSICVPLAFSALYEIVEWWWVIGFYSEAGPEWLGHQGDHWDAQWDMCMAMCGAACAVVVFGKVHDWSIDRMES